MELWMTPTTVLPFLVPAEVTCPLCRELNDTVSRKQSAVVRLEGVLLNRHANEVHFMYVTLFASPGSGVNGEVVVPDKRFVGILGVPRKQ
jgi:hypothetical protein